MGVWCLTTKGCTRVDDFQARLRVADGAEMTAHLKRNVTRMAVVKMMTEASTLPPGMFPPSDTVTMPPLLLQN